MKIDKNLNLVLVVEGPQGDVYAHSAPMDYRLFERYARILSRAFINSLGYGLGENSSWLGAVAELQSEAEKAGKWLDSRDADGKTVAGVKSELIGTIERTTSIFTFDAEKGTWGDVLLCDAELDRDVRREILGKICFFTLASATTGWADFRGIAQALSIAQRHIYTPLGAMEYRSSLAPLTTAPAFTDAA